LKWIKGLINVLIVSCAYVGRLSAVPASRFWVSGTVISLEAI
jgi:hypothetical protein